MNWEDENDDFDFNEEFSDDEQKEFDRNMEAREEKIENHSLHKQCVEIIGTLEALAENFTNEYQQILLASLLESAIMIRVKIESAMDSESWLIAMQNAAIVRDHAAYLLTSARGLEKQFGTDKNYLKILQSEMMRFKSLFNDWVMEIQDFDEEDYEDEWGLFLREKI